MKRMSSQDAAFLYAETPSWHMHVAALAVVEPEASGGRFSASALRALTEQRLPSLPPFRWQLVDVPLGVEVPGWIEADEVDLDYHLRHVTLPPPGSMAQLDDLVASIVSTQLDRSRPLWEMYLIDGLHDGRAAVLTKVHHSLVDGVSGAGLTAAIMDITPEPRAVSPEPVDPLDHDVPDAFGLLVGGLVRSAVTMPGRLARFGVQTVRQGVAAVTSLGRGSRPVMPYTAPRTHFNGEFTARRALGRATLSLDRLMAVKSAVNAQLGETVPEGQVAPRATLNDVVLALCAGALRDHLIDHGSLPDQPLVVQVPVSLRNDSNRTEVGSLVGSMFATLATHVVDPLDRLHHIRESTVAGKAMTEVLGEHRSIGMTQMLSPGALGVITRLLTAAHLERGPSAVNLVVSNVPGPPMPLYLCGAPVVGYYPMGPLLLGMGLNVTVFSHDRQLDVGVFACPDLVNDPRSIADRFEDALSDLEAAVGL